MQYIIYVMTFALFNHFNIIMAVLCFVVRTVCWSATCENNSEPAIGKSQVFYE
jgi:hypothetical protein